MTSKARFVAKGAIVLVALALLGALVMLLWNSVVPGLFGGARPIDYPHALGLLLLSRLLFGGFRGHGGWHARRRWARWQALTPEERMQFRDGMPGDRRHGGAA